jgi:hypothetical protein
MINREGLPSFGFRRRFGHRMKMDRERDREREAENTLCYYITNFKDFFDTRAHETLNK